MATAKTRADDTQKAGLVAASAFIVRELHLRQYRSSSSVADALPLCSRASAKREAGPWRDELSISMDQTISESALLKEDAKAGMRNAPLLARFWQLLGVVVCRSKSRSEESSGADAAMKSLQRRGRARGEGLGFVRLRNGL